VFPLALHEQACPTSRRGLGRLGSDPSVECIYTTVDVAAVQLNIYPWTHGTSGFRCVGLAEQIQIASFSLMENWQTDERMIKSEWY
jgi:hypothetical protein